MSYMGKVRPTIALTSSDIADNAVTSSKIIADAVTTVKILDSNVTTAKMGTDPTNASNLSSGDVPLAQLDNVDTSGIISNRDDIALLGFKVAANGSLAKYNLVDQTVDDFQDTSGVDASASTNEVRDSSGKYYSGTVLGSYSTDSITATGAGTWTAPADTILAEVLIVAGGAGGAYYQGGGGGAGGVVHDEDYTVVPATEYDVTVGISGAAATTGGSGGYPHTGADGSNGGDSVWNVNAEGSGITMTAIGGGGGGSQDGTTTGMPPKNGGSGGGTGAYNTVAATSTQTSPTGAVGYGNSGGVQPAGIYQGMAGGGGAAAVGANGSSGNGGDGGAGRLFSNFTSYGASSGYFSGGGAGGTYNAGEGGTGGIGGGGTNGGAGTANTGGGGAGGRRSAAPGAGGSGVFLIRHRTEVYNNMTLVSTTTAAQAAPTKGDVVFTYTDSIGTATLGTDLTAEISADGGSTWTAMTLGSEGSTGTHKIATAHDVTISSTITAPWNMAYRIKSLNQSGTKATRIQAVSLGWS
jgi:hypothetical protein